MLIYYTHFFASMRHELQFVARPTAEQQPPDGARWRAHCCLIMQESHGNRAAHLPSTKVTTKAG